MIERAIEKIKSEMEQKKDNSYIQAIGDYLLKQVEINRNAAEKICNEKKSIEKSLKEVEKVARKKAVAGCAVLSDNEVFKIVREYYQFEAVQDKFIYGLHQRRIQTIDLLVVKLDWKVQTHFNG